MDLEGRMEPAACEGRGMEQAMTRHPSGNDEFCNDARTCAYKTGPLDGRNYCTYTAAFGKHLRTYGISPLLRSADYRAGLLG